MEKIITKAIELKNEIVKKDLHEKHLRKSLNFGHNIGHALESSMLTLNKDILHGEAVAAGMIMEALIAKNHKQITPKACDEICDYINSVFSKVKITKEIKEMMLEFIKYDKKNVGENLCFALPKPIGQFDLNCAISLEEVEHVISEY